MHLDIIRSSFEFNMRRLLNIYLLFVKIVLML